MGKHNQAFKGFYVTPWGKFDTRDGAYKQLGSDYPPRLDWWCKDRIDQTLTTVSFRHCCNIMQTNKQEWVGKTFRELGFNFEPAKTEFGN